MLMVLGFCLAAYAVVANDSIQTLGTFIASNSHRPWWLLWAFASSILVGVLLFGWVSYGGDPAYGRLEKFPLPTGGVSILDFIYGSILLVFKEWSNMPMSTTWLFIGLLAGRELAMTLQFNRQRVRNAWQAVGSDAGKAFAGLVVSVALAFGAVAVNV